MSAYHFFIAHAGYSYDPKTQTPMQGRRECAKYLAYAESRAQGLSCSFHWEIDPDVTSANWADEHKDGGRYCDPWRTWCCVAYDGNGKVFASLGGIDFGRNGEPWGDPYHRVIEAELACELPLEDES